MDTSTPQVRNTSRPALLIFAAIYCLLFTLKMAYWIVGEGWGLARTGDIAFIMLLPLALACILLVTGSLLLWARRTKSSWCLLGVLLLGLVSMPLILPEIVVLRPGMYLQAVWYLLPDALQAVLLIAVWLYSLRLRRNGYFQ